LRAPSVVDGRARLPWWATQHEELREKRGNWNGFSRLVVRAIVGRLDAPACHGGRRSAKELREKLLVQGESDDTKGSYNAETRG
jgi:hypothetical protein